jgi:hypothetical protein
LPSTPGLLKVGVVRLVFYQNVQSAFAPNRSRQTNCASNPCRAQGLLRQ